MYRVKLHAFEKFEDTAQALAAATAVVEGKLDKDLKSFLKKWVSKKGLKEGTLSTDTRNSSTTYRETVSNVRALRSY